MKRAKTHSSISPTDKFYLTQSLSEYKLNPRQLSEVFEALEQIENNKIENENVQFKCFERVETLKNVFIVLAVFLIQWLLGVPHICYHRFALLHQDLNLIVRYQFCNSNHLRSRNN